MSGTQAGMSEEDRRRELALEAMALDDVSVSSEGSALELTCTGHDGTGEIDAGDVCDLAREYGLDVVGVRGQLDDGQVIVEVS